jgi:hypothetical protein
MVGEALTVTVAVFMAITLQPALVPLTVNTVVEAGLTVNVGLIVVVLQVYDVAPLAVKVAVEPAHTVAEFTVIDGAGPTVTCVVAVLTQPVADVPVTV